LRYSVLSIQGNFGPQTNASTAIAAMKDFTALTSMVNNTDFIQSCDENIKEIFVTRRKIQALKTAMGRFSTPEQNKSLRDLRQIIARLSSPVHYLVNK
jgi:hypothetical protein